MTTTWPALRCHPGVIGEGGIYVYEDDLELVVQDVSLLPAIERTSAAFAKASALYLNARKRVFVSLAPCADGWPAQLARYSEALAAHVPPWALMPARSSARYLGILIRPWSHPHRAVAAGARQTRRSRLRARGWPHTPVPRRLPLCESRLGRDAVRRPSPHHDALVLQRL